MTVMTEVKSAVEFVNPTAGVGAEMLVRTYVPEYSPDVMTFQEALDLALLRDERAAADLEASIMAALDSEEDPAEDDIAAEVVNMLLANAERADAAEREANGPWEVLTP